MRYLILTDIHANLEALDACLEDAGRRGYGKTLVLGDLVGYGADPNAVVARVRALESAVTIRGNHDKIACGLNHADGFNVVAKSAALWTLKTLTPEHRAWLAALPQGPLIVDDLIEICHGSPVHEDAYIFDDLEALRALKAARRPLCVYGHTHFPAVFELSTTALGGEMLSASEEAVFVLQPGSRYLVNPGAVGQPRDNDPRAAYGIVDTSARRVELFRMEYAVAEAQSKVIRAGLPDVLAFRLGLGR
jgi:diadenosine tetraphosphatase ApaH/serine/threonine PP2A family protein phosphatase